MDLAILDYGVGNMYSISKLLDLMKLRWIMTSDSKEILKCRGLILPGVGGFKEAAERLKENSLDNTLREFNARGRFILGICLGMQLLFENSSEGGTANGLGFLEGEVVRIPEVLRVPHTGWNQVHHVGDCRILHRTASSEHYYFTHSYYAVPKDPTIVKAYCSYGVTIPAVVNKGKVYGVQFHPEKSGEKGIKLLNNIKEMLL